MPRRLLLLLVCALSLPIISAAVSAQTRSSVSATEVNGTFRDRSGSSFRILALGGGELRVAFEGVYVYKMTNGEDMANTGTAGGIAEIKGDTAIFKPEETTECTIILKFLPGKRLRVTQQGTDSECGFGVNVNAGGTYRKISSAKPRFDR